MTLALALIAAAIALSQAWLLYSQARESRVSLCTEVVDLWQKSSDSWRIMIAVAMGGGSNFYAPALSVDEKRLLANLKDTIETFNLRLKEPLPPGENLAERVEASMERLGKAFPRGGFTPEQLWLSEHCRNALGALSLVAELVLTGRVSTGDAYAVLGLDIARRSKALREVLFRKNDIWLHVDTMATQRGMRDRILALADLMWVEAARRDDLPPWTLEKAAELKRSGTGRIAKERMRVQCTAVKSGPITRWRMERKLTYAERDDFGNRASWN